MSDNILPFRTDKQARAEAEARCLSDVAVRLRNNLKGVCARHAIKCLEADGIDLDGVDYRELTIQSAINIIVWLEEEAKRIRKDVDDVECELEEMGIPRTLDKKLEEMRNAKR